VILRDVSILRRSAGEAASLSLFSAPAGHPRIYPRPFEFANCTAISPGSTSQETGRRSVERRADESSRRKTFIAE
jgi:hypothetical protein